MTTIDTLAAFLEERAQEGLVSWEVQEDAARTFNTTVRDVEGTALSMGLLPSRYARNRTTIGADQQKKLFQSTVAVVGCGGLGGYVIEELARLGVGTLLAVDPDTFEDHNLNRQILCAFPSLGKTKVEAAEKRVAEINPACTVVPLKVRLTAGNAPSLLDSAQVAVDCLDNIGARLELADACAQLAIPLVHGAIGGWYGLVLTQGPSENRLRQLYGEGRDVKGIEETLGNLSFTAAVVAGMEAAETCKLLIGEGGTLKGRMLFIDLFDMSVETFET